METTKERPILFSGPMVRAILEGRKTQTRRLVRGVETMGDTYDGPTFTASGWRWKFGAAHPFTYVTCPYGAPGDRMTTRFADASPPCDGWYWVRWEPESAERLVWLARVADELPAAPPAHDVERWVWSETPNGDPESVCLDVREPLDIQWRRPGDRLWVRETWMRWCSHHDDNTVCIAYRASNDNTKQGGMVVDNIPWPGDVPEWSEDDKWRPSIHMPRWVSRITLEVIGVRVERLQEISEEDAVLEGMTHARYIGDDDPHGGFRRGFADFWDDINGKKALWSSNPWVWVVGFRRLP